MKKYQVDPSVVLPYRELLNILSLDTRRDSVLSWFPIQCAQRSPGTRRMVYLSLGTHTLLHNCRPIWLMIANLLFLSCLFHVTEKHVKSESANDKENGRRTPPGGRPEHNNNSNKSSSKNKSDSLDTFNGFAANFVSNFRPGRLTPIEILTRLFPTQRKAVLELVLQGCSGDLVKAIEHFLSASESQHSSSSTIPTSISRIGERPNISHPHQEGFGMSGIHGLHGAFRSSLTSEKHPVGSMKSAFTPLPPSSAASSVPLLFAPRPPHPFHAEALLGRTPLFAPSSVADLSSMSSPAMGSPRFAFPALHPFHLSGKFPTAGEGYPRLIFAPYATCPPDCVQCPGSRTSMHSEPEKSPSGTTDGSVANSAVDSE